MVGWSPRPRWACPNGRERGRDYDYRYVWIRDQCYAGQAVAADAAHPLLDDAVAFVAARLLADGPHLAPAYTVDGSPGARPAQHLDLPGYPGGTDIVGNHVNAQFQLDAFGEALLLFAAAARHDHLDTEHVKAVDVAIAAIEARHHEPDAGIWELDDRRWTHSRLTCAAGLYAIAEHLPGPAAVRAIALADALVANTSAECLHPDGRWQRTPDDPRVDAALLLPALRGAVPATDPRSTATLAAVAAELGRGRLPLPVPARRAPARPRRGRVHALRLLDGVGRPPAGPPNGGAALVRAQPSRMRVARPALRGVRRHPAPAARQPAPGVRARAAPRDRRTPGRTRHRLATRGGPVTQTVVITGASAGIARATAVQFAARGANVALLARGRAGLEAAAKDVQNAGGTPLVIPTDVADVEQVERAADRVEAELGPDRRVGERRVHLRVRPVPHDQRGRVPARHRSHLPRLRLRHHGRARPDAPAQPRNDRAGRLGAGRTLPSRCSRRTAGPSTPSTGSPNRCAPSCCTSTAPST